MSYQRPPLRPASTSRAQFTVPSPCPAARWPRLRKLHRVITVSALLVGGNGWLQAQSDTTGPTLDTFSISPAAVDLTDGAKFVTFSAEVSDPSGVFEIEFDLILPNGARTARMVMRPVNDEERSTENEAWTGNFSLPQDAMTGTYEIGVMHLQDNTLGQNLTTLFGTTLGNRNLPNSFTVTGPGPPEVEAPTITTQPTALSVEPGGVASFSVGATGTAPLTYQWKKDGVDIAGAQAATYEIAVAEMADAGEYTVVVSNQVGSVTSMPATLSVTDTPVAPEITTQPAALTVETGGTANFSVEATGTAPLTYQWKRDGFNLLRGDAATYAIADVEPLDAGEYTVVVSNRAGSVTSMPATLTVTGALAAPTITSQPMAANVEVGGGATFSVGATGAAPLSYQWRKDGQEITGATMATYTITGVALTDAGEYSVVVANQHGQVTSQTAALSLAPHAVLTNLSVRATLERGQVLVVGAVVSGGRRDLLIRAAGPALEAIAMDPMLMGLPDPQITLFGPPPTPEVIGENDDWNGDLADTFVSVGAFAFMAGSTDSAHRLAADGSFTVHASGKDGQGSVLVEVYDLSVPSGSRLSNVSARSFAGMGADTLTAGFVIAGTRSHRVLIRAIGPALAEKGVEEPLADPTMTVFDRDRLAIEQNDDWDSDLADDFAAVGAFPLPEASKDAALVADLPPGTYTVQVLGADGGVGEALIEVYEIME